MDHPCRDIFEDALTEARKTTVWDKLTLDQQSRLVSRYIMQQFTAINPDNTGVNRAEEQFVSA